MRKTTHPVLLIERRGLPVAQTRQLKAYLEIPEYQEIGYHRTTGLPRTVELYEKKLDIVGPALVVVTIEQVQAAEQIFVAGVKAGSPHVMFLDGKLCALELENDKLNPVEVVSVAA